MMNQQLSLRRVVSHPDVGGGLVLILLIERHHLLSQKNVVRSHGGLQLQVDRHLAGETKQLQHHRLHGVQVQRARSRYQVPERPDVLNVTLSVSYQS